MDFEALRAGLSAAIPFNVHIGLEVREVAEGRGVVALPDRESLRNHVGSQHAGALFSAGEAASGAAFLGTFAERLGDITPLAENAEITYEKVARGEILATAALGGDAAELIAALEEDGRVRFSVAVSLTDAEDREVARMTVGWYVRAKGA